MVINIGFCQFEWKRVSFRFCIENYLIKLLDTIFASGKAKSLEVTVLYI